MMVLKRLLLGVGLLLFSMSPSFAVTEGESFNRKETVLMAHVNPEVMRMINEAIEQNPNDPQPYLQRGLAYNHLEEYQKALNDFNRVLELDADNVDAYNFRGTMYFRVGDYERALADYNQAMNINPDYALLYFNRGYVRIELGKIQGAIEDFQKGANLAKKQGDLNTYQQAQAIIEKLKVAPESVSATN